MEKGASNGLSTTDKNSSSSNSDVAAFHSTLSQGLMMMMRVNLDRPFEGGGAGGANEALLSRDDVVSSCCGGGGENFRTSTCTSNFQSFDIFPASYPINQNKSPVEMAAAAASVCFPFTFAQWRELERQAMIYKYMMYSVPVPPDLLLQLTRNFPDSSLYNMTTHSRNGDPEPGRCKRTDGKKWRCTKEVAPHQKYCERHLHRGRPRSRKPVEPKSSNVEKHNKRTRPVAFSLSTSQQANDEQRQPLLLFGCKPGAAANNGDLGLVMEAEMAGLTVAQQQQWQLMMGFASEGSSSTHLIEKDYMLGGYSNPEMNVSPSLYLSMTMAVGNILDDEVGKQQQQQQLRGGVEISDGNSSKDLKWLNPVSWEPFAAGGPLAEALHLGSPSPHDSTSTPPTAVSSPSGVLQRAFFSHSDSSVCNSPTTGSSFPPRMI